MRKQISKEAIEKSIDQLRSILYQRLEQKGYGSFASIHEISGILREEYKEFEDEVHANNETEIFFEMYDIAVACVFAAACMQEDGLDW